MQKLTISGELPTMNQIIQAAKTNWSVFKRMKDKYDALVFYSAKSQHIQKVECADFRIVWYRKNRLSDKDNVIAGQKFVFDGLQKAGVLANDGWSQIGSIQHEFVIDKKCPRVEIFIMEKR